MAKYWDVLGIRPTSDLNVIKEARRVLIRTWHPDVVSSPELRPIHTARCAEINAAYDDAIKFAKIRARLLADIERERHRPGPDRFSRFEPGLKAQVVCLAVFFLAMILMRFLPAALRFAAGLPRR